MSSAWKVQVVLPGQDIHYNSALGKASKGNASLTKHGLLTQIRKIKILLQKGANESCKNARAQFHRRLLIT